MEMTTSSKQLKWGVFLSYAYTFSQVIVNLFYVPLLLRGVGESEYGLYQLIGSLVAYMSIFNLMFQGTTTRYYCKYFAMGDTRGMESVLAVTRNIYRILSVAVVAIAAVGVPIFRLVYKNQLDAFEQNEASIMLVLVALNLIVTMHNSVNVSVITAHEKFSFLKGTQLFVAIAQPVAVIAVIRLLPYAAVISFTQLIMNGFCATVQRIYARKRLKAIPRMNDDYRKLYREILAFSSGIVLALVADQIFWNSNQLILGYIFGMSIVAIYGIGVQIQRIYMMIGTAISNVFLPKISLVYHKDAALEKVSNEFINVGRLSAYPLLLVLTGFILFGRQFIYLWVGEGYGDVYWIVLALIIPLTIDLVQNIGLSILQVMNRYAFRGKIYFAMAILNIPIAYLLAMRFGAIGAALCSGVLMFSINGPVMNAYYHHLGLDIWGFWKEFLRVAVPSALLMVCGMSLQLLFPLEIESWGLLIVVLVAYTVVFALTCILFTTTKDERSHLGLVLKKKLHR